jgi:glycyl-tRNA synthetase beta chain
MRWGAGSLRWVRPLHSILCILTDEAGRRRARSRSTGSPRRHDRGPPFHGARTLRGDGFRGLRGQAEARQVILTAEARAEIDLARGHQHGLCRGLEVVEDKGLLAEVAGLVEWPVVLMGEIGESSSTCRRGAADLDEGAPEVLFGEEPATGRIERFVTVANRETADNGATILAGNQKVLAARLSDAKFFWENDLRVARRAWAHGRRRSKT